MSINQSPLVSSSIKCPVCNTVTPQTTTKTGAYRVNAKDTDFRPSEVIWVNPEYQTREPLLFFMATCPRCFYTHEYTDEFKAWENDFSFVTYTRAAIAQKHLTAYQDKNGLLQFLGPRIDPDKYPTETAIIKLILGIHNELLLTQPSALNVGRYFLRIAWLFRGRIQPANGADAAATDPVARLRREIANVSAIARTYGDAVKTLQSLVESIGASTADPARAEALARKKNEVLTQLSAPLPPLVQAASAFAGMCEGESRVVGAGSSEAGFHSYGDFEQFLVEAKQRFPEIPTNEHEALATASAYYIKAFERGSQVADGIAQVQAAYLIAEISRRAGDFATADRYFMTTMKSGRELTREDNANAASVNQIEKLLATAVEQARLSKQAQQHSS
jgi:hypothetical protein